jgi:D-alanyl-D-alanine carboxypeptidase
VTFAPGDLSSVVGMTKSPVAVIIAATVAATAVVGIGVAQARTSDRPVPTAFRPALSATLQADADALRKYGAPGVLVGLNTPRGDVRVRSGYGNVAKRTPVPWDAKFRIGSYTKPFVAATVLQLVGERKLSLDDKVERFLPGVIRGKGNDGRKITVRQLLQHTSGLHEYTDAMTSMGTAEGFRKTRLRTWTSAELVGLAMRFPSDFAPGTSWSYSNTNYVVAGMIIKEVTGHTWQHEVRERIVEPLGLRDTYLPGTSSTIPRPHAVGYQRFPGSDGTEEDPRYGEPIDVTLLNPSMAGPAGEMISTTDDANTFLRALMTGKVLKAAQRAEMLRTVATNDKLRARWPGARYGLGILWGQNSCGGYWTHGGDIPGFMTRNGVTPDGSRSVTVSINTDSLKPDPGLKLPTVDVTTELVDHALCDAR